MIMMIAVQVSARSGWDHVESAFRERDCLRSREAGWCRCRPSLPWLPGGPTRDWPLSSGPRKSSRRRRWSCP